MTSVVKERLATVLGATETASNIRAYFMKPGPGTATFTGRLFEQFGEGGAGTEGSNSFRAEDLLAVEALSVQVPPDAAYALLHGSLGSEMAELLEEIPSEIDLGSPAAHDHIKPDSAADQAWRLLDAQYGIAWVTAGKLMARKRPRLLPVYDEVVACVLGYPNSVWGILDQVLADPDIRGQIESLRPEAPGRVSALRVVDVAIWMHHHTDHSRRRCTEFGRPLEVRSGA